MAKKEKKVKELKVKKQKKQKKQAPLVPEHQRPLICPPDQAGRGLRTRILGYVCRCLVVMCLCWALMMFFGGSFKGSYGFWVGVSEFTMLGLALFATAVFGLICYNRFTALGGLALGAAGIAILSPNVVQGVLALYNGFLCRLYLSRFTLYLSNLGIGVPNLTSGESLAGYYLEKLTAYGADGMLVMALLLSAVFVPLIAKRTRPVLPTIVCLVIIVPVCVFNIASSGLGAGMLIASVAAVLVMWAYDKMFRRPADADKYDTKLQMFTEQDKPAYPEEYLQKKREKAEKKLQKKLAREQKKQKRKKDKTVEEEISSYFDTPKKKVKVKKPRLTEQEKKALKLQKKQEKLHKKEVRKQVRIARRYEQVTDSAKSAMGGFASAIMLAVCVIVIIIPALTIKNHMVIELLDEKISYARAYVTAALMGDDERLDELEYELDNKNFLPHSTELEHITFDGTQLFFIESQYPANLYLRGWIGVDYKDGAWYPAQSSDDEENPSAFDTWRDLYGTKQHPSDQMFYDFYKLSHPELEMFDPDYDFLNKYHKEADLGFVAMRVHLRRVNSYSSHLYLPSVFDQSRGLYGYGNNEPSEHSFVNYFDGVLTGRDFAESGTKYSAMTFAPIKTDKDWIGNLAADVAEYNLQKELILAYSSYEVVELSYGTDVNTKYSVKVEEDVPERGLTTISYRRSGKVVASFIHESDCVEYLTQEKTIILTGTDGTEYVLELDSNYKVERVSTENENSLLHRYITGKDSDKREIDRILFGGDLDDQEDGNNYTNYVYTYYTGKSESKIIADLADKIYREATYKVKEETGEFEHIEAVTHEEYRLVEAVADLDWSGETVYYTKEIIVDENGEEIGEEYLPAEAFDENMVWAGLLYELVTVVDEEAYDQPIYAITEYPFDFTYAAMQGAAFDAATAQRHDLVKAVIDYIIEDMGCTYTLTPDLALVNADLDGVENFLTNTKEGYCVQFASAVALILREYGIPTRFVEGYIACDFNTNSNPDRVARSATYVHDYEAHAWIEVFFDGIGWVQYECTPAYYAGMYGGADSTESEEGSASTPPPSIKDEIDDIVNAPDEEDEDQMSEEELEEEMQRRSVIIASIVFVSVVVVVGGVIAVLSWLRSRAAAAEYKKNSAVDTILSDHFGQNTSEDDRRELSYTVIDALHNILDIYGLSPEPGEFKDEYARRLAYELEDILGRSPEYEVQAEEIDPNAPPAAELPVSPHRMGQIMDAIAAEEFGHGMSIAQMKLVSALYKDLRANVHKRVPFGRRMVLRYFKNRL
ncbi:MAG: transglutaminase domain-containing protein [Ruminococcaceae bacterium]|nr:transglutaminase domain-containing protein [Oscillospiraceae bacterium]